MSLRAIASSCLVLAAAGACGRRADRIALRPGEGMVAVPGGKMWYRVVGTGRGTPLLVIHGGPGSTSCIQWELSRLGTDRPVIFYDQLGTGRSERPADTTLWNLPRSVAEVDSLRGALGLDSLHLLGHSWGATVALEYMLTRPHVGVKTLILVGPLLSTPRWLEDARILVSTLSDSAQRAIAVADSTGDYDTPAFAAANEEFGRRYLIRNRAPLADYPGCKNVEGNGDIYRRMWGPSEFRSTGTLKDYDRTARLGELNLPVLLLGGEFDEARPETLRDFQQRIPGAEVAIIPGAGHGVMVDEPEATAAALNAFLDRH
jgi:proline iminopeptidase